MPAKIRLQRHGKKKSSFFHIVIADERAPRDGKFIEKIGTYNPNTNPATIDLQFDKALTWLKNGAQPTDTTRAILSYEGVIYKNHLDKGVLKGAFSQESADKKFEEWKADKMNKIQKKTETVLKSQEDEMKKALAAEAEVNKKRAEEILAKNSEMAQEAAATSEAQEAKAETPAEEVTAETPVAETATEETTAADVPTTEAPAEEAKSEEPKAETKEVKAEAEKPAEEPVKEEAKVEEPAKEEEKSEAAAEVKEEKKEEVKAEVAEEKKEEENTEKEDK